MEEELKYTEKRFSIIRLTDGVALRAESEGTHKGLRVNSEDTVKWRQLITRRRKRTEVTNV